MTLFAYIGSEELGAWRNGTRVVKAKEDPGGDLTPIGTPGVVLGSMRDPQNPDTIGYFVEWANRPGVPVCVVGWKIKPASV